jgi:hypothetical protein
MTDLDKRLWRDLKAYVKTGEKRVPAVAAHGMG